MAPTSWTLSESHTNMRYFYCVQLLRTQTLPIQRDLTWRTQLSAGIWSHMQSSMMCWRITSLTFTLQTDLKNRKHESWSFPRGLLSKQSYLLHTPGFPSYLTAVSSNAVCLEWISGRGGVMATAWDTECENLNQKVPLVHTQRQTVTYLPYSLK